MNRIATFRAVTAAARDAQVQMAHGRRPLIGDEWAVLSAVLDETTLAGRRRVDLEIVAASIWAQPTHADWVTLGAAVSALRSAGLIAHYQSDGRVFLAPRLPDGASSPPGSRGEPRSHASDPDTPNPSNSRSSRSTGRVAGAGETTT